MLFLRTTHDASGNPRTFSKAASHLWQNTEAGMIGHMMHGSTWTSLDRALADARVQANQDLGADQPPASIAEMLLATASLLREGMIRCEDRPADDAPFLGIRSSGRRPDHPLHPVARALLQLLDPKAISLETLRRRANSAYPGTAKLSVEEMLVALADLLHMGYATYSERRVAENQTLIRDHALTNLVEAAVPA